MKLFNIMDTAFDNFDNTVRNYLAKTFNNIGLQYTHSQIFGVIFDGIKGIMQNIMFYIEDSLNEQNVYTATRKQSIYSLAKISGYEPNYGNSATGTLIASMHINNGLSNNTSKIYIKNHSKLVNKNSGFIYSLELPVDYYVIDIEKPLAKHEFNIVQGTYMTNNYVTKGLALESIHVHSSALFDINKIQIKVNGIKATRVGNLYDMTNNGIEYILNIGFDNGFDITFGDGIHGNMVEEGQTVEIEYLTHAGTNGNINPGDNTEFIFTDYGKDTLGDNVNINDFLSLSLSNCVSGGTNSDNISFIKSMIGSNSRSSVLASEENFKLFFKRFSFIGYVNCWSESNSMTINVTCLRNFKSEIKDIEDYYNLSENSLLLDNRQKTMIQNTLDNSMRSFAGITLKFQDPIIRKFAIICYVKIDNSFDRESVSLNIKKTLAKYFFELMEDTQFVSKSKLINNLHNDISEITSIDFDFISELNETAYRDGYYDKHELTYINSSYKYVTTRVIYEKDNQQGLDKYGNISLDSKLEIPILSGGFYYYPDKENNIKTNAIIIDAVQIYFI